MTCRAVSCFLASASLALILVGAAGCAGQKRFEIIDRKCGTCHPSDYVYSQKRSKNEWDRLVHGMKVRGLKITPEEEKKVKDILYTHYSL